MGNFDISNLTNSSSTVTQANTADQPTLTTQPASVTPNQAQVQVPSSPTLSDPSGLGLRPVDWNAIQKTIGQAQNVSYSTSVNAGGTLATTASSMAGSAA